MSAAERVFRILLRVYPRTFRERYRDDLLAFFRQDRQHPRYGSGPLRPLRFWTATLRDLSGAALEQRLPARDRPLDRRSPSSMMSALAFDLRYAVRSLRSTPAVTSTALLVLTLAIGAGTAIFAVVDAIVLRGLPFRDEPTLVSVSETDLASGRHGPTAYPNFVDWSRQQDVFEGIAASEYGPWFTTTGERPERLRTHRITANLFGLLGVGPAIGRDISADEERTNAKVALISHAVWRRVFGSDPNVAGRTITFETGTYDVIGVMPRDFVYPIGSAIASAVDLWIPLSPTPRSLARTGGRTYSLRVVARLKPGVSITKASARMQQIRDMLAVEYPPWFADQGVSVRPIKASIVGDSARSWMLMLLAAVVAVFLIACANLANLLLARASGRAREVGVRAAMGASRGQIVQGLLVESVVLAVAGAAGGVLLAYWGIDLLRATLPPNLPRLWSIAIDLRVLGVAVTAAILTGVLCGILPAAQMSRADVADAIRSGGRSATPGASRARVRNLFLCTEVALATVLLIGAGVFTSSFVRLVNRDLGFSSDRVLSIIVPPKPTTGTSPAGLNAFGASMLPVLERLRALPGVDSAALVAGGAPLTGSWAGKAVHAAGRTFSDDDEAVVKQVTGDYFTTVGATVLKGRSIGAGDTMGTPSIVVLNDEAQRRYFGGRDPLGAQLAIDAEAPRTVVGVVRGMRLLGPETEVKPEVYVPFAQSSEHNISASLVVRTSQDPAALIPTLKDGIWSVMPGAVIADVSTFEEMYSTLIAQRRLNMILLAIFAGLALLIASIGIYGMLAYLVEGRTKEIGVRMALGALPGGILRMVLGRASLTIGLGLLIGCVASLWLERLVMAFVFQGIPRDPVVYGGVAALLMAVGLLAAFVPARRAARVDPLVALRAE